jgi:hypothetical protein
MRLAMIFATLVTALICGQAAAQGFPARPVRIVIGFTPGSATDVITRTVSQKLVVCVWMWGCRTSLGRLRLCHRLPPDGRVHS